MNSKQLNDAVNQILNDIKEDEKKELTKIKNEVKRAHSKWDVPATEQIKYFDPEKSYELSGYIPINNTSGLDFKPEWFTEARDTFERTGHYTQYAQNTKAYADFWDQEYKRCQDGMTVKGYTITGDHYFFLNYYQLMDLTSAKKAGTSRLWIFPRFFVAQYIYFHYLDLVKRLKMNAVMTKARGIGFSEINACLAANAYNCRRGSQTIITSHSDTYTSGTLNKVWNALNWLNAHTDNGFFKLRQVLDTKDAKRASHYKVTNGQKIETGWMSEIRGIVADDPRKLRGDRTDMLIMEESGSWPNFQKTYIQGQALIDIQGSKFGICISGGTGGDSGAALAGLREMFFNPEAYETLPFKHNCTMTGENILTGFFIPAHWLVNTEECMDERGYTDPEKGKEFLQKQRNKLTGQALLTYCAEHCFTVEEAFANEGNNTFDKEILSEQLTSIRVTKTAPKIETGNLSFIFRNNNERNLNNVAGYKWDVNPTGKVHILEHPVWTDEYKRQQAVISDWYSKRGMQYETTEKYSLMNNLYVAGIDSIDIGMEDTSDATDDPSKFCIIIFRRQFGLKDPVPVAYYMDRPQHIRDAYKIAMCMVTYYQAIVNIEATRMNLLAWARDNGYYKYFMMRPRATYPDPNKIGRRTPGTPATPTIIQHQLSLIESYIEDFGQHIWFEELVDQLTRYSLEQKTKFDMVAAFAMALLANEELGTVVATKVVNYDERKNMLNVGYYFDDRGIKHFGTIPVQDNRRLVSAESYVGEIRSSDPRKWNN